MDLYLILSQKSIAELSQVMPTSMKELKTIHGIGPQKLKQFGLDILEMCIKYRQENNIETVISEGNYTIEEKSKEPKIDTKKASFELFKAGKTMQEIAKERNFSLTTIEGHLANYITSGEIDLYELIDRKKAQKVIDHFLQTKLLSLTPAKEALGNDYSYGEIRMVLAFLKRDGQME